MGSEESRRDESRQRESSVTTTADASRALRGRSVRLVYVIATGLGPDSMARSDASRFAANHDHQRGHARFERPNGPLLFTTILCQLHPTATAATQSSDSETTKRPRIPARVVSKQSMTLTGVCQCRHLVHAGQPREAGDGGEPQHGANVFYQSRILC